MNIYNKINCNGKTMGTFFKLYCFRLGTHVFRITYFSSHISNNNAQEIKTASNIERSKNKVTAQIKIQLYENTLFFMTHFYPSDSAK